MTAATAAADLITLEDRIGYRFQCRELLQLALTHRSWRADNEGADCNERLEFLGDAVLGLVVAHGLYGHRRGLTEGEMSKARASVVNNATLAKAGRSIKLGAMLRLGQGEEGSGGRGNSSILANAVEAVIGAAYLDGGMATAQTVVRRLLGRRLQAAALSPGDTDFKTLLQNLAAKAGYDPPRYDMTATGPEHDKRFRASVSAGSSAGVGEGRTKKDASQRAAEVACWELWTQHGQEQQ